MIHGLLMFASEEAETSKTAFYILGSVFAAWAVVVSAIGISRHQSFPPTGALGRAIMGLSFLLMVGAMGSAILTS